MVRVSDEGRDLLNDFARRHGVSVSALIEALALSLPPDEQIRERGFAVIELARTIDADRRRRG